MSRPTFLRFADASSLGLAAALQFLQAGRKAILERGRFNVALSGGQGPLPLYEALQSQPKTLPWSKVRFYWVDERWVPDSDPQSNFGATRRQFLEPLDAVASARPINTGLPSPQEGAQAYADTLLRELGPELPSFDLCLLGMGADGHTASLFPGSPELKAGDKLCVATRHPDTGQDRVTLTLPVLNASREVLFLVRGAEKEPMLAQIHATQGPAATVPAALVRGRGTCTWLYSL